MRTVAIACVLALLALVPSRLAAQASAARQEQTRRLERSLLLVKGERDESSTLLPWMLTTTGIILVAVGLAVGAGGAIDCEDSCQGAFWPSWLVMGGATFGTVGAIWLTLERRDIAELESRVSNLENQLQMLRWDQGLAQPRVALSLRGAF